MAQCPRCNEPLGANDYLPGQAAACPRCGSPGAASDQPWWVAAAPVSETIETTSLTSTQTAPKTADKSDTDSLEFEMPAPAPPPKPVAPVAPAAFTAAVPKDEPPEAEVDDPSEPRGSFFARQYAELKRLDGAALAALFLGSLSFFAASLESLEFLAKWFACAGLTIGVGASVVPAVINLKKLGYPVAMCVLCLFSLVFVGSWTGPPPPRVTPPKVRVSLREQGMTANEAISDDDWVDASAHAAQRNEIRVEIVQPIKVKFVELKKDKKTVYSTVKMLSINLRISYQGNEYKTFSYETWADDVGVSSKHPPTLIDSSNKTWPQNTFGADWKIVGRDYKDTLGPGGGIVDVLNYPISSVNFEFLQLRLPAAALGGAGEFRFQIPRAMIEGL
jgi:hypothetical protein